MILRPEDKIRAFVALKIPEDFKQKVKEIQDKLPDFYGKFTELDNLHLTLKFLGEIDSCILGKVREKLREIKFGKFKIGINELGVFSEKYVRIVWLSLSGSGGLQESIDKKLQGLGFFIEQRFMCHLTIARVKSIKSRNEFLEELNKIEIPEDLEFEVKEFVLMKSVLGEFGPKYTVIEEFKLV